MILAKYAISLSYGDLSKDVVHEVKRKLLDTVGCSLGAKNAEPIKVASKFAYSIENKAFLYSAMSRYLDWMDTYVGKEFAHPSDNIGAVLAAAEAFNSKPKDVITAISVAYDVQCNLADVASLRAKNFDHTLYVAIATAAGISNLLKLSQKQTTNAISIATVSSLSLRQGREGKLSNWKGLAAAHAAKNGLFAALLARENITGPEKAFEGEKGLFSVLGKFDLKLKKNRILDVSLKKHNVETQAQSAIDATLDLREGLKGEIKSIEIEIWKKAIEIIADKEKWNPQNRETADHSLPYMVAIALLYGEITPEYYSEAYLRNPKIGKLVKKIKVKENKMYTKTFPKSFPTTVRIKTTAGIFEKTVNYFKGHPRNPMSDREVESKFVFLTKNKKAIGFIWNLEKQESISKLVRLLK